VCVVCSSDFTVVETLPVPEFMEDISANLSVAVASSDDRH